MNTCAEVTGCTSSDKVPAFSTGAGGSAGRPAGASMSSSPRASGMKYPGGQVEVRGGDPTPPTVMGVSLRRFDQPGAAWLSPNAATHQREAGRSEAEAGRSKAAAAPTSSFRRAAAHPPKCPTRERGSRLPSRLSNASCASENHCERPSPDSNHGYLPRRPCGRARGALGRGTWSSAVRPTSIRRDPDNASSASVIILAAAHVRRARHRR